MATPTALQLKEEGNALYVKQDYLGAHEKYSEAIVLDGKNAVFYLDAASDAHQATDIDPSYAKGWSRLATSHDALLNLEQSVKAWQGALKVLPKTNLSAAELKQKEQYTAALKKATERAKSAAKKPAPVLYYTPGSGERPPWELANEILPEVQAGGIERVTSSAWVIVAAYEEFNQGTKYLKQVKRIPMKQAPDGYVMFGHTDGIMNISNGLLRDTRVFHMDSADWIKQFNEQIQFETQKWGAWPSETVETVIQNAQERQKSQGWDDVRPALGMTVRAWIMHALFDTNLRRAHHVAVEFLKHSLEVMDWGRRCWKNVPDEDRGVIFDRTFVRGMPHRAFLAHNHDEAYATDPGLNSKYPLEALFEEATDLLKETTDNPRSPSDPSVDPGFISSFYIYPAGEAHAMIGFYHAEMGKYGDSPPEVFEHFVRAGEEYGEAALKYPPDDEKHCWYLLCALENFLTSQAPVILVQEIATRLRRAVPQMKRIWAHSAMAKTGRDKSIELVLRKVDEEMRLVREGKKTMQDNVNPRNW
ncbi:hypothetical protein HYDPIDRAFT_26421 [Hydnomerulius pinastri MD-312]|nr:hypothetical protein HYDPIDRAFT_26421 [Hydnomerulius pinastri MD-312]